MRYKKVQFKNNYGKNGIPRKTFTCLKVKIKTTDDWFKKICSCALEIEDRLNAGQANTSEQRSDIIVRTDNLSGLIAEYCCEQVLKNLFNIKTCKPSLNTSYNQIDILVGKTNKTVEVRSSCVRNGIEFALFAKNLNKSDEQYIDVIGPYKNNYKPGEIEKDYYMRVIYPFEKKNFLNKIQRPVLEFYVTGGATKSMMQDPSIRLLKHMKPAGGEVKFESDYIVIPLGESLDYLEFKKKILQDLGDME